MDWPSKEAIQSKPKTKDESFFWMRPRLSRTNNNVTLTLIAELQTNAIDEGFIRAMVRTANHLLFLSVGRLI
jgi:hypothetical protein